MRWEFWEDGFVSHPSPNCLIFLSLMATLVAEEGSGGGGEEWEVVAEKDDQVETLSVCEEEEMVGDEVDFGKGIVWVDARGVRELMVKGCLIVSSSAPRSIGSER